MPEIELHSSAGRLRAVHDPPTAATPARGPRAALVCHPHPVPRLVPGLPDMPGGTLENKVVHALAKTLCAEGLHVLRFDFRGAGGSDGEHDFGRGEHEDVRAALDLLVRLAGRDAPLLAAGFSFGSYVALDVGADDPRVSHLLAVAPPVDRYDYSRAAGCGKPLALISAVDDELVPRAALERFVGTCREPPLVLPVTGAGHLFHGRLGALREAARRAVLRWRGEAPDP